MKLLSNSPFSEKSNICMWACVIFGMIGFCKFKLVIFDDPRHERFAAKLNTYCCISTYLCQKKNCVLNNFKILITYRKRLALCIRRESSTYTNCKNHKKTS